MHSGKHAPGAPPDYKKHTEGGAQRSDTLPQYPDKNGFSPMPAAYPAVRALIILLTATLTFGGCNKVTDPAPEDPKVPDAIMQLVEKTYQNPQNMVFTEILDDKIWNVKLESQAKKYSSTMSMNHMLVAYRMSGTDAPDTLKALIDTSVVVGGTFSNFREQEFILFSEGNYEKTFLADYHWKGEQYLFKWGATFLAGQKTTYTVEMEPVSSKIPTTDLNDLPQRLQEYLQLKQFQFLQATISVTADAKTSYRVRLRKNNIDFDLLFDHDCKLLAGSDQPVYLGNGGEVPAKIRAYLDSREEFKGFGLTGQFSGVISNELDGVKSYVVNIQTNSGSIAGLQAWFLIFDENANPIARKYFALY